MASATTGKVIFQGSKFFWRTRNTVDVTIIEHQACKVTEVVCYEPSLDVEATRTYLDSTILERRVDHAQIEEKMSFGKRNNVPHTEKFVNDIVHQAIADYVLNRLFQTDFTVCPKKFEVAFQLNFRDVVIEAADNSTERLIRGPPSDLTPFTTHHNKIFTECEKDDAMKALDDAKKNLQEQCLTAMALQAQPELPLGIQERWRIPIVLGKLAHNRCLSGADSKIWDAVASHLKTQEDIDRITKVTLRTVEPEPAPAKPEPAPKPVMGFGRFFLPVKRMISSAPAPTSTPVRSPCPTPRSTSRRMMADTASSQRRADSCAEDNAHKKKSTGNKKKKTSVRRPTSRQRDRSAGAEAQQADNSESSVNSGTLTPVTGAAAAAAPCNQEAASFMRQLVAGLTFSLSECNRVHSMPLDADPAPSQKLFSARGSVKNDCTALVRTRTASGEVSMERRHLGALNPHLLGTASTSPSLKTEFAFLNCTDRSPVINTKFIGIEKAGYLERSETAEISCKHSVYDDATPQPRMRRSYLGSFLATFSGMVDTHASAHAHAHAQAFDSSVKLSTKEFPSRRAGIMGFDWLLNTHGQTVVPVEGVEYQ